MKHSTDRKMRRMGAVFSSSSLNASSRRFGKGSTAGAFLIPRENLINSHGSEDHSSKVDNHMLDIMVTCIEECDDLTQRLLDVILLNLLPSYRVCSPHSSPV